jgi:hypothetical protein
MRTFLRRTTTAIAATGLVAAPIVACNAVLGIESDPTVQTATIGGEEAGSTTETEAGVDAKVEPKTCKGTIHIRAMAAFSGATSADSTAYHYGYYDFFRKLNDTGGLRGCLIDLKFDDNKGTADDAATVLEKWRADPDWPNVSTVFVQVTASVTRVAPEMTKDKKILMTGSYAGSLATPQPFSKQINFNELGADFVESQSAETKGSDGFPYVYFVGTDYSTAIRLAIHTIKKQGPARIAMGYEKTNAFSNDPIAAGKSYLTALQDPNLKIGRDLKVKPTSTAGGADEDIIKAAVSSYFDAEINQVAGGTGYTGVNWVWCGNTTVSCAILGKAVALQNDKIKASSLPDAVKNSWKVRVITNTWGFDETTAGRCGAGCNDIVYGLFPVPLYGDVEAAAGMRNAMDIHDEYAPKDILAQPPLPARNPEDYKNVRYIQAHAQALMWKTAMERAIDAGHENPTGDDLRATLDTFTNVSLSGMTSAAISFTATDHRPQATMTVYKLNTAGALQFVDRYPLPGVTKDWLGY